MTGMREELIHLSEELPEAKVQQAVEYLRSISGSADRERETRPFAWFGVGASNNARTDNARRVDELLADGFGADFRG